MRRLFASRKGAGPPHKAILALAANAGGAATFTAAFAGKKKDNRYGFWVANICTDADGETVTREDHPIVWNGDLGTAGPYSTAGTNPSTGPISGCRAYVWNFPDTATAISNTVSYVSYAPTADD